MASGDWLNIKKDSIGDLIRVWRNCYGIQCRCDFGLNSFVDIQPHELEIISWGN